MAVTEKFWMYYQCPSKDSYHQPFPLLWKELTCQISCIQHDAHNAMLGSDTAMWDESKVWQGVDLEFTQLLQSGGWRWWVLKEIVRLLDNKEAISGHWETCSRLLMKWAFKKFLEIIYNSGMMLPSCLRKKFHPPLFFQNWSPSDWDGNLNV